MSYSLRFLPEVADDVVAGARRCSLVRLQAVVNGGAWFLGSDLTDGLLTDGHRVIGIDSFEGYYARRREDANLEVARQGGLRASRCGHPGDGPGGDPCWRGKRLPRHAAQARGPRQLRQLVRGLHPRQRLGHAPVARGSRRRHGAQRGVCLALNASHRMSLAVAATSHAEVGGGRLRSRMGPWKCAYNASAMRARGAAIRGFAAEDWGWREETGVMMGADLSTVARRRDAARLVAGGRPPESLGQEAEASRVRPSTRFRGKHVRLGWASA